MSIRISIKHPMSVIDGRKITLQDAFSWILNYYDPHKNDYINHSNVLDSTCSQMLMWLNEDKKKFNVVTNDVNESVKANYHISCDKLCENIAPSSFDIIIYDPPYIDLKNRDDSKKYEDLFNYTSMKTIENLENLTRKSSYCFNELLRKDGIIIAKITNFHYKNRLRGSYDYVNWFNEHFYLFDEIIYRFYKNVSNLNFYKKKAAKTHSYFLIFKKKL